MAIFRKRTRFQPLVEEFERVISRRCRGTRKAARTDIGRLRAAVELLGVTYAEDITPPAIAAVLNAVEARGLAGKTVNEFRGILSRLCSYLVKEKAITIGQPGVNPVFLVPRRSVPDPVIVYLTLVQVEKLLEGLTAYPQLRAMAAVMILAGLRRAELLWLTMEDVDTIQRLIPIRPKVVNGERWRPKTGRARSVPVSARLMAELGRYRPPAGSTWFFPSPQGYRWDGDNFRDAFLKAQEPLGTKWSPQHLRHTFGTLLAKAGVSLYKIGTLMGNSPEVCRRHYAALLSEELRAEVEISPATSVGVDELMQAVEDAQLPERQADDPADEAATTGAESVEDSTPGNDPVSDRAAEQDGGRRVPALTWQDFVRGLGGALAASDEAASGMDADPKAGTLEG